MLAEDLHDGQLVALNKEYCGLPKGFRGEVIGYSPKEEKALVKLFNKNRTEEKIPIKNLIGVLFN